MLQAWQDPNTAKAEYCCYHPESYGPNIYIYICEVTITMTMRGDEVEEKKEKEKEKKEET